MKEIIVFALDDNEIKELTGSKDEEELSIWRSYIPSPPRITGELIRCKDCKHYEQWTNHKICMLLGSYYGNTQPNDYCSNAERRES